MPEQSAGGCCIYTADKFPLGIYTHIEVEFQLEGTPVRLSGVIQSIHNPNHVGICFLDLTDRKQKQLKTLLETIEENPAYQRQAKTELSSSVVS